MYLEYCGHNIVNRDGMYFVDNLPRRFATFNDAIAFVDNIGEVNDLLRPDYC